MALSIIGVKSIYVFTYHIVDCCPFIKLSDTPLNGTHNRITVLLTVATLYKMTAKWDSPFDGTLSWFLRALNN